MRLKLAIGFGFLWALLPRAAPGTMIVMDLVGDGVAMTDAAHGVQFDLDGDGQTEKVSWTKPDSDDAILALDVDSNGRIDSGKEVVGRYFRLPITWASTTGADVLIHEMQNYQKGQPLPPDAGEVNGKDPYFSRLLLWVDRDHDGKSSPQELTTLTSAGVTSIFASFSRPRAGSPRSIDDAGNGRLFEGSFLLARRGVDFKRVLVEYEPLVSR